MQEVDSSPKRLWMKRKLKRSSPLQSQVERVLEYDSKGDTWEAHAKFNKDRFLQLTLTLRTVLEYTTYERTAIQAHTTAVAVVGSQ